MKENWTYKKLTDVCDIQYGYPFDSANFSTSPNDGMPLIRIRDVKDGYSNTYYKGDYPKEYIIHEGDYLVGMDGEFNIAPWKSEDALLNQRVCKVASKSEDVSMGFLYRFLIKELKKIEDETPFVTVKHLSAKRLNQVLLPVPPIEIQSRIVSELDLLQSIIDKQKAQLKELDNLAQAVFYDMFGDPVENDKGWEVKTLKESVIEMFLGPFGSALKTDCYVEKENSFCMVYEQKHAIKKTMDVDTHYIDKEKFDSLKRFEVHSGDFIMSCRGTIGEIYRIPNNAPFGIIHPSLMKIRIREDVYHPTFFLWLLSRIIKNENTNGNCVQMAITAKELGTRKPILPPLSLQQSFASKIDSIEKQKAAITKSIEETQKLFDYTMDKYFG